METTNPLLCDVEAGICGLPDNNVSIEPTAQGKIKVVYFTDPICSSCWGIEPQLRKLKLEYGEYIDIEYHMGGLLPSWDVYNSGGISKPSDVAHHWDEVSHYYEMPIDGNVWLEDPLSSSYPASIAFYAAQLQDAKKAQLFLRLIREMVFLEKKNISKMEHLVDAAAKTGLDVEKFKIDFDGEAKRIFNADLEFARRTGVRGFPTLLFSNNKNESAAISGVRPYEYFRQVIQKLNPGATPKVIDTTPEVLFNKYQSLTLKEFSVIADKSKSESEKILAKLVEQNVVSRFDTRNGSIWSRK